MIEDKRYCVDILQQISAISAALKAVQNNILKDHTTSCVATALKSNKKKQANKIKETIEVMNKFNF